MIYNEEKILIGIGDNIKSIMFEKDITLAELSRKTKIAPCAINKYLVGSSAPTLKTAMILCNALDVHIDKLIGA